MSDEPRPLNVRCAEALGWSKPSATGRCDVCGWPYDPTGAGCLPSSCSMRPAPAVRADEPPPYGENTPKGWACTGPLIERFVLNIGCDHARWYVFRDTHATGAHGSASTAIAEWVARYVKNGEVV